MGVPSRSGDPGEHNWDRTPTHSHLNLDPLQLETRWECGRGGVNLGCASRDLDGCGWGFGPSCALGGRHCG